MDIRRLEAFSKVYELGSFSKAGQEMFLSQPTISAHILSLESELGVPLFDRLGRSVIPTQAGEILYRYANDVFALLENARTEIKLLQDMVSGTLAIGASTIPAHYLLPRALAGFTDKYPDARVRMKVADSEAVMEQIAQGELEVGIVGARPDAPELVSVPVMKDDLIVIASPLRGAAGAVAPVSEMASWPWIMRERGSGTRQALAKGLKAVGADLSNLPVALEVESTLAVLQCVRENLGVSVTSRLAANSYLESGELVEVPVSGLSLQREFYAVHHAKRRLFPVARYFVEYLTGDEFLGTFNRDR